MSNIALLRVHNGTKISEGPYGVDLGYGLLAARERLENCGLAKSGSDHVDFMRIRT
jgi:hypothetical protein